MPVISMFYGLIVRMYSFDTQQHRAPHIHIQYGEQHVAIGIPDGNVLDGDLRTNKMKSDKRRFPKAIVAAIRDGKILGLRAGTKPHRIIGIWAVVVENRVFVRSWSLKPRGWYRAFREEPRGVIVVGGSKIPVRAVFTRSERLKKAVDRAYRQ